MANKKNTIWFGPSTLIAAAFIGPGTITMCSKAGASFSYELVWALVLSILITLFLQEMASRLGLVTQKGLGEAIESQLPPGIAKLGLLILSFAAIVIGNAAYESGNLGGAILGLSFTGVDHKILAVAMFTCAVALLWKANYYWIEKVLISLVIVMSFAFIITLISLPIEWGKVVHQFWPRNVFEIDRFWMIAALIGTTVVPYNLFLHASTVSKKWKDTEDLSRMRKENNLSILLGGFISMSILMSAAHILEPLGIEVDSAAALRYQVEPILGRSASWVMSFGLFAAGLSSAITAPLAASLAAQGLFGWTEKSWKFTAVWFGVLFIGLLVNLSGIKPIIVIQFAQIANAALLPIIVFFLLYLLNDKRIMGSLHNGFIRNLIGGLVLLFCIGLSFKTMYSIFF